MVTTAFSLLAASIAFVARTGILLFMLAVSPIFFIGIIFPKIKQKVSGPLLDVLQKQLIFMPVYLFLLYVALRILSDPGFNSIFSRSNTRRISPKHAVRLCLDKHHHPVHDRHHLHQHSSHGGDFTRRIWNEMGTAGKHNWEVVYW
jgi:hypothetical protein